MAQRRPLICLRSLECWETQGFYNLRGCNSFIAELRNSMPNKLQYDKAGIKETYFHMSAVFVVSKTGECLPMFLGMELQNGRVKKSSRANYFGGTKILGVNNLLAIFGIFACFYIILSVLHISCVLIFQTQSCVSAIL